MAVGMMEDGMGGGGGVGAPQQQPMVEQALPSAGSGLYHGTPEEIRQDGLRKAEALKKYLRMVGPKGYTKMQGGSLHLRYESWAFLASLYGVTAELSGTEFVQYGEAQGFEAKAVAIHETTGRIVGRGEGLCLNSEKRWKSADLFQVKSMAQTRARSNTLSALFRWVAILAGVSGTAAEEMEGGTLRAAASPPPPTATEDPAPGATRATLGPALNVGKPLSEGRRRLLFAVAHKAGHSADDTLAFVKAVLGVEHFADVKEGAFEALHGRVQDPTAFAVAGSGGGGGGGSTAASGQ